MSYQEITAAMMASDAPLSTTLINLLNSNTKAMSQAVLLHTGIAGQVARPYAIAGAYAVVETYSIRVPAYANEVKVKVQCKCATSPGYVRVKVNGVACDADKTIADSYSWETFTVTAPGTGWVDLEILGKSGGAYLTLKDVFAYVEAL